MSKKDFVTEHKRLVKVLHEGKKSDLKKEAKEQGGELQKVLQGGGPGSGRRPGFSSPEAQKMHTALVQNGWKRTGQQTVGNLQQHQYEHEDYPRNQVNVNDSKQGNAFWQHVKSSEDGRPNGGSFGTHAGTLDKYLGGVHFRD